MFSKIRVKYFFKNYVIFWGGGGEVIKRLHWIKGGGGGLRSPKKDYVIFQWSLKPKTLKNLCWVMVVAVVVESGSSVKLWHELS